jgi:hypothetical protein
MFCNSNFRKLLHMKNGPTNYKYAIENLHISASPQLLRTLLNEAL